MVPRKVKWTPAMLFCLLAAAAVFGFTADRAAARLPACGDTVKADVKLKADLEDCPNNGLLIGANGVEIDLNGHTISGDGKDHRPCPNGACDLGIAIEHHKGVTVGGGRVTGFGLGIDVFKAAHVLVHDIDAPRNTGLGLAAFRSQDIAVQRLHANHNAFSGILYFGVTGGVVRASAANSDGLDTDQAGMSMIKSRDVRISHNTFARNGDIGFYSESLADVRIAHNRIVGNPEAGMFAVESSKRVEIRSNRISHAGDGIILDASHSRVARNRITDIQAPSGARRTAARPGSQLRGAATTASCATVSPGRRAPRSGWASPRGSSRRTSAPVTTSYAPTWWSITVTGFSWSRTQSTRSWSTTAHGAPATTASTSAVRRRR